MAITHVGGAAVDDAAQVDLELTLPTVADDDFAVLFFYSDEGGSNTFAEADTPSGWSLVSGWPVTSTGGRDIKTWLFTRRLVSSDASVTVTATYPGNRSHAAVVSVFRGVDTSTALDVAPTGVTRQNNASPSPAAITTVTDGSAVVLLLAMSHGNLSAFAAPSGYTLGESSVGLYRNVAAAYDLDVGSAAVQSPAGWVATGASGVEESHLATVALRPEPDPPPAPDPTVDITYVGGVAADDTAQVDLELTLPTVADDDFAVVLFYSDDGGVGTFAEADTPSGWSLVSGWPVATTGGRPMKTWLFTRRLVSSDASVTVTATYPGNRNHAAVAGVFRGVSTTTALDVAPVRSTGQNDATPTNAETESVTDNTAVVLLLAMSHGNLSAFAAPSGYTLGESSVGLYRNVAVAYQLTSGPAGTRSPGAWTATGASGVEEHHDVTVVLRPASSTLPSDPTPDPVPDGYVPSPASLNRRPFAGVVDEEGSPPTPDPGDPPDPTPDPPSGDFPTGGYGMLSNPVWYPQYGSSSYGYQPDVSLFGDAYTVSSGSWEDSGSRPQNRREPTGVDGGTPDQAALFFTEGKSLYAGRIDGSDRAYMNNHPTSGYLGGEAQENSLILTSSGAVKHVDADPAVFPGQADAGPHRHTFDSARESYWTESTLRLTDLNDGGADDNLYIPRSGIQAMRDEGTAMAFGFEGMQFGYWPTFVDGVFRNAISWYVGRPRNVAYIQQPTYEGDVIDMPQGLRMATFKVNYFASQGRWRFVAAFPSWWNGEDLWLPGGAHLAHTSDATSGYNDPNGTHRWPLPFFHLFVDVDRASNLSQPLQSAQVTGSASDVSFGQTREYWNRTNQFVAPHAELMVSWDPIFSNAITWMVNNRFGLGRINQRGAL